MVKNQWQKETNLYSGRGHVTKQKAVFRVAVGR